MSASFKINVAGIKNLAKKLDDAGLKNQLGSLAKSKPIIALVAQSIADNFAKNGPGWPPLKFRQGQILRKSGLLFNSVTTPNAQGNINRAEGHTLIWGTNLSYAKIHNEGGIISVKNSKALFIPISEKGYKVGPLRDKNAQKQSGLKYGIDFIFKKSVIIPKREFLIIHREWKEQIYLFANKLIKRNIQKLLGAGS